MSTNHQLPLVSAVLKPANNSTSLDEVAEALKRIGKSAIYAPDQIKVGEAIHDCFGSYQIDIVRQIVGYALENPDSWLKLHPQHHVLVKMIPAMQIRLGLHPGYPQPLIRDRYRAFEQATQQSARTARFHASRMINEFARVLVDYPGQLIDKFDSRPRHATPIPPLILHGLAERGRLKNVHASMRYPIAIPDISTHLTLRHPAGERLVVKPSPNLIEVKAEGEGSRVSRYQASCIDSGSAFELDVMTRASPVRSTPASGSNRPFKIFGCHGTGGDLYQTLFFLEKTPIECYSISIQFSPKGAPLLLPFTPHDMEEATSVADLWPKSRLDTFYGFYVVWNGDRERTLPYEIPHRFSQFNSWFLLQVAQPDKEQRAVA
ncbi:hypothetical protein [Corynebacterium glutamicum]|uniref:hypothetical protein n=1 Tax=Corynebacterium glutamicum TaxID=1718 RepID=UPI000943C452|nr:hypothetical protein [Corynebacterium glutamicum]OKX84263.1 hypothetical protein AUO95_03505 [Corynebacterium glutamicum]